MRTLGLLTALLLMALQAQAGPLQKRPEEAPVQEQPELKEDDVTISIIWDKNAFLEAPVLGRLVTCSCRRAFCDLGERHIGTCFLRDNLYAFCCS
uniref:Mammalian defensins domain-containing protein n=1 Tax=Otolemur garnettii TaxID=30611 RepID=H0XHQ2_OTOGA